MSASISTCQKSLYFHICQISLPCQPLFPYTSKQSTLSASISIYIYIKTVYLTLSAAISVHVSTVYIVGIYFHICQNNLPCRPYSRRQNSLPSVVSLYSGHLDSLPLVVSLYLIRQNCLIYLVGLYSRRQKSLPCWPVFQSQNNLFRGVGLYSTMSEQPHVFHSVGTIYLVSMYVFHNVRTIIDCHPVFQSQNDVPLPLVFQTSQLSCFVM